MRIRPAEPRRSFSIYLPNSLYLKLENKAGRGQINTFIKQVLEKELGNNEEQLKQQLISDYQSVAESKKAQKEAEIWDETLNDAWKKDE